MASNLDTLVTVFGGSGFLGRSVVRALCKRDYRIRVAVRRPELAGHLQPLGKVGQIHAVQANLRYPASVEAAMRDSHVAINLVGILAESGAQTFEAVQGRGAGTVAKAAAAAGARMVHVSAIGADENSPSRYARAKAAGEKAVLSAAPGGHYPAAFGRVRPRGSVHQPFRGAGADVAGAAADRRRPDEDCSRSMSAMSRPRSPMPSTARPGPGATYELGGPEVLTMREIMEIILAITERQRMLVSLPFGLAKLQALFLQFAPGALKLTPDQVELLRSDNVVSDAAKAAGLTLEGLGIAAGFAGSDRPAISLALPRRRPVPAERARDSEARHPEVRPCAPRRMGRMPNLVILRGSPKRLAPPDDGALSITSPSPARPGRACRR